MPPTPPPGPPPRPPDELRSELRSWLEANWDPTLSLVEWRTRLADAGWASPTWPAGFGGRGLSASDAAIVSEELTRVDAPGPPEGPGMILAAPTILEHGADEIRRRLVPPTVTGELTWCQLFSEPGAGSDLAGLTTRARLDGDEWVVSGQKVWTTSAHHASYGMLLARTDPDVPKHRGITYFAIELHQPGVEVRPLRQMNGYASFNEVFLDEARVPVANVVGEVGNGWAVARTTLAHERRLASSARGSTLRGPMVGRARLEAAKEHAVAFEPYRWYPQRAGRADLVPERARATGAGADPLVRQEAARLAALERAARWTAQRAAAARARGGQPGPEGSIGKLSSSDIARAAAKAHARIAGATGMLAGADAPLDGIVTEVIVSVPAVSIAGGTDEIQRTIIGERVLGLPREPDVDRDVPFRDVRTNVGR